MKWKHHHKENHVISHEEYSALSNEEQIDFYQVEETTEEAPAEEVSVPEEAPTEEVSVPEAPTEEVSVPEEAPTEEVSAHIEA